MGKTRPPYPPEFRRQMVELVRSGRNPEELDNPQRRHSSLGYLSPADFEKLGKAA